MVLVFSFGGARACGLAWGLGALVYGGHDGWCSWLGRGLLGLITLASQCLPLLVLGV